MSLFNDADKVSKFEDLVGEGKRYSDNDAVAKAIAEKDRFIEQLKREAQEAREAIASRPPAVDRTQEILDQLEALKNREPVTGRELTEPTERTEVKSLTPDDIERILAEREAKTRRVNNVNTVKAKLVELYGDKYGDAVKLVADKNGLSAQALDNLAAQSPQLVLNLFEQPKTDRGFSPPTSTASREGFAPTADGHKPRSWWNELKAKDPTKYFSQDSRMQQYKDAMVLKEAFEDV